MKFTGTSSLIQGGPEQQPGEAHCSQLGRCVKGADCGQLVILPLHTQKDKQPVLGWVPESRRGTW